MVRRKDDIGLLKTWSLNHIKSWNCNWFHKKKALLLWQCFRQKACFLLAYFIQQKQNLTFLFCPFSTTFFGILNNFKLFRSVIWTREAIPSVFIGYDFPLPRHFPRFVSGYDHWWLNFFSFFQHIWKRIYSNLQKTTATPFTGFSKYLKVLYKTLWISLDGCALCIVSIHYQIYYIIF